MGLIGGMIEPQETAEAAVERHLREKAGIAISTRSNCIHSAASTETRVARSFCDLFGFGK